MEDGEVRSGGDGSEVEVVVVGIEVASEEVTVIVVSAEAKNAGLGNRLRTSRLTHAS